MKYMEVCFDRLHLILFICSIFLFLQKNCLEWKGQIFKKIYVSKITQHEEKFFHLVFLFKYGT